MTRVRAAFVGCKISQADGEEALAGLEAAGVETTIAAAGADVVVVHTCCVTAEAERKSRRLARRLAASGSTVLVAGCAAVLHPEQFGGDGMEVVGRPDWTEVGRRLVAGGDEAAGGSETLAGRGDGPAREPRAALDEADPREDAAPRATAGARTRHVLKVQDGCAGVCSYCVVRLVRGRPRSVPLAAALDAARAALDEGCGEVVLSGVDLGAWADGGRRLPDLVIALAELPGLTRLRLSSLEPHHLDERLLDALAHPRVARHLHVPLQSADDGVLRAMRRPYTFAAYEHVVSLVRARVGACMLSTDVIAGFPGEDDDAFARTLAALDSGLFGRVHVFGFSARPGTAAAELPPLPAALVKERTGRALAAAGAAARAARLAALGRPAEVLVEERRRGLWRGYSSEYVRYHLEGEAAPGALVAAVATGEYEDGVKGRIT